MKRLAVLAVVLLAGCGTKSRDTTWATTEFNRGMAACDPTLMNASVAADCRRNRTASTAPNVCDPTITNPHLIAECLGQRLPMKPEKPPTKAWMARLAAEEKVRLAEAELSAVRVRRDYIAREYCSLQAQNANMMTRGIVAGFFTGLAIGDQCLEFYNRTGAIPGQLN